MVSCLFPACGDAMPAVEGQAFLTRSAEAGSDPGADRRREQVGEACVVLPCGHGKQPLQRASRRSADQSGLGLTIGAHGQSCGDGARGVNDSERDCERPHARMTEGEPYAAVCTAFGFGSAGRHPRTRTHLNSPASLSGAGLPQRLARATGPVSPSGWAFFSFRPGCSGRAGVLGVAERRRGPA